jgi:hypothetical protein
MKSWFWGSGACAVGQVTWDELGRLGGNLPHDHPKEHGGRQQQRERGGRQAAEPAHHHPLLGGPRRVHRLPRRIARGVAVSGTRVTYA